MNCTTYGACNTCIAESCYWCDDSNLCANADDTTNNQCIGRGWETSCDSSEEYPFLLFLVGSIVTVFSFLSCALFFLYKVRMRQRDNGPNDFMSPLMTGNMLRENMFRGLDASGSGKDLWMCIICGFDNKLKKEYCLMCGTSHKFSKDYKAKRREEKVSYVLRYDVRTLKMVD